MTENSRKRIREIKFRETNMCVYIGHDYTNQDHVSLVSSVAHY